jgi:hypothetical protein
VVKKKMNNPKYWAGMAVDGEIVLNSLSKEYHITDSQKKRMLQTAEKYIQAIKEIIKEEA